MNKKNGLRKSKQNNGEIIINFYITNSDYIAGHKFSANRQIFKGDIISQLTSDIKAELQAIISEQAIEIIRLKGEISKLKKNVICDSVPNI